MIGGLQAAVLCRNDLSGEGKPDSEAVFGIFRGTVEPFKDMRQLLLRNALSGVGDRDFRRKAAALRRNGDRPALRGMLDRIFQQIHDRLRGVVQVTDPRGIAVDLYPELHPLELGSHGHGFNRLPDQLAAGNRLLCKPDSIRFDPRQAQHGFNQPFHPGKQLVQVTQIFFPFLLRQLRGMQQSEDHHNRCQRRPELVGNVLECFLGKLLFSFQLGILLAQPDRHFMDLRRKYAQLTLIVFVKGDHILMPQDAVNAVTKLHDLIPPLPQDPFIKRQECRRQDHRRDSTRNAKARTDSRPCRCQEQMDQPAFSAAHASTAL